MLGMTVTDFITASGVAVASLTFVGTVVQNRLDQTQQTAAQTREDLQAIIGDSGRFLHPLLQGSPYPILYTASTITKEFCSRMGSLPKGKDVQSLLQNKDLLRSICVDGWIASTQILRLMEMVEELERKASSHLLRGKLLLICQASFLLAGIVAKGCSPTYFFNTLSKIKLDSCQYDEVDVALNQITVELQNKICQRFNDKYKEPIILCLSFIQKASRAFMRLHDRKLVHLARHREFSLQETKELDQNKMYTNPLHEIEQQTLLSYRLQQVKDLLTCLKEDLEPIEYEELCDMIELLNKACVIIERI